MWPVSFNVEGKEKNDFHFIIRGERYLLENVHGFMGKWHGMELRWQ